MKLVDKDMVVTVDGKYPKSLSDIGFSIKINPPINTGLSILL